MPSNLAHKGSCNLGDQLHCSVSPVFFWTPDLLGGRLLSLFPCVHGGSHSQDQSNKAEDRGAGRGHPQGSAALPRSWEQKA